MVTLDDNDLTEFDLEVLENHDNPLLPETRDHSIVIPGMHGVHDMGSDMGPAPFNIPLGFKPQNSYADLRFKADQFTKFILDHYGNPRPLKLKFDYYPDRYWMVKYSGQMPIERLVRMGRFTLPLIAHKPMAKSNVETYEIHWDSEEVSFDDAYSLETIAIENLRITSPQTLEAYVNWYAVRPTILINGSGDNVTFQANGKSFSLKNFRNSTFEIIGETFTVMKNGVNGYSEKVGKDFVDLLPGMNQIQITGSNMNFTLSVRVRDQHM